MIDERSEGNDRTNNHYRMSWHKMDPLKKNSVEKYLREYEMMCVSACGKFLKRNPVKDNIWLLKRSKNEIQALLIYSYRTLLPVFKGRTNIPEPEFINRFFRKLPVHSVQGLKEDVIYLEEYLLKCNLLAIDKIDYNLMYIDNAPEKSAFDAGPKDLIIRRACLKDMDELAVLQAGYEKEEVLPLGADFNPSASYANTERIYSKEQLLVAEFEGRLVGKINTSAVSFTRFQIGGVFVLPEYRSMGIARRMTGEFITMLIKQGRGISLFVKKSNFAGYSVYSRLGFKLLADYRINYY